MRPFPHVSSVSSLGLALALLLGMPVPTGTAEPPGITTSSVSPGNTSCREFTSESVPIEIELSLPDANVPPGGTTRIKGRVIADDYLADLRLTFVPQSGIELAGPSTQDAGALSRGQGFDFEIPVKFTGSDPTAIMVRAASGSTAVPEPLVRVRMLYVLFHDGFATANMSGHVDLALRAIERDRLAGRLTEEEAEAKRREATRLPGVWDSTPHAPQALTADQERLSAALKPARNELERPVRKSFEPLGGTVTVRGTIQWTDENGATHPAWAMTVEVRDEELIGSVLVADGVTDQSGFYEFVVDNDDGLGAGNRDIFVRIRTANSAIEVAPMGLLSSAYEAESGVTDEAPDGSTITENFTTTNTGTGPAGGILTGGTWIASYTAGLNGGSFLGQCTVEWPGDPGSFFDNGTTINLSPDDDVDWDVLHHEYGHYVMDEFSIEDNPGGGHSSANCATDVRPSKDEGLKLAWGEGWPTYFGLSGQQAMGMATLNVPRVGDTSYSDRATDGTLSPNYSLETPGDLAIGGEGNERAIMRLFWDLFDNVADGRDNMSESDQTLFDRVNGADPDFLSQAWSALRSPLSNQEDLAYGGIAADQFSGPIAQTPAAGAVVSPSNRNFTWTAGVNCGTFAGNSFDLKFYDAATFALLLTVPGIGTTSTTISEAQVGALAGATHNVLWAVEGRNSSSPATGPYLGSNNAVIVNRPPVADAGPDQPNVECTSPTTTSVALNGLGSSDPDGDALTYTWTAPGIVFDNPNSATPIGQFPEGTTVVTLTVSDGIDDDTDTVSITVVDTTPPVIVCPADIVVECTETGGTPATDPQLAPFFAGVSATDVCDTTPTITDNAPPFFPKGETTVTFTATDDDLNASNCQAKVQVVDTTPPTITVTLDRDALWPPNHKLADIHATVVVEDICDPNPTFVLTSITSNEPIDGTGDGDTAPDWTDSDFGTPDVDFMLRSERAGTGSGRRYTIVYTASDADGNTASAEVFVRVAHDQNGAAMAVAGLSPDGTFIDPNADEVVFVIPSAPFDSADDPIVGQNLFGGRTEPAPGASGFDALRVQADRAWLGNVKGVVAPSRMGTVDVNNDGMKDLALFYSADAARAILEGGIVEFGPLGLHYVTRLNESFLVPDVLGLGGPMAIDLDLLAASARPVPDSGPMGVSLPPTSSAVVAAERERRTEVLATPAETRPAQIQDPGAAEASPADPSMQSATARVTAFSALRPNPTSGGTTIFFELGRTAPVRIEVFDVRGMRVRTVTEGVMESGAHSARWDGKDQAGRRVAAGVYVVRFAADGVVAHAKAILMR
ncbi:MAG: FlgD immunoglobulin-like domain containing protein [Candidatus Eiseniibacteriota bacterium]